MWLGGTFIFAWILNWTISARSMLPLLPAASILIMRRIEERASAPAGGRFPKALLPLIPSSVVALAVAHADMQLADSARRAAQTICQRFAGREGTVWFQGHWGFQYYMEMCGAKAADIRHPGYESGDVMVIPHGNTNLFPLPSEHVASREMIEIQASRYLAVMNERIGAGFYSHRWGPLPYSFGRPGPERYEILHMKRPPSGLSGKWEARPAGVFGIRSVRPQGKHPERPATVSGLMSAIMLPMWLLSGIFFAPERFPDFMQPLVQALPLTQLNCALRAVVLEGAGLLSRPWRLLVPAAGGGVSFVLALRWFRWD